MLHNNPLAQNRHYAFRKYLHGPYNLIKMSMISDWMFKKSLNACLFAYIINVVVYQTH